MNPVEIIVALVMYAVIGLFLADPIAGKTVTPTRKTFAAWFLWPFFVLVLLLKGLFHLAIGAWETFRDTLTR